MFRKILMTTVAASAMVGSAFAADLPRRAPPPAYVPPVPIFTWTGFYIGVNGGGMFRANNRDDFANAVFFGGAAPVGGFVASNNASVENPKTDVSEVVVWVHSTGQAR